MAAEQTFSSPGFFETETLTGQVPGGVLGVPAGVVGTSEMGPAFVPITVGSFSEFTSLFGGLDPNYMAPYAVAEFLRNRSALTFVRVLGAGGNTSAGDIATTQAFGTVKGAGFIIKGSTVGSGDTRTKGCVQFIAAKHLVSTESSVGYPEFQDNVSFALSSNFARLVRGMVLLASGTRLQVLDATQAYSNANASDDAATIGSTTGSPTYNCFKLVVSSSTQNFATTEGFTGIRIFTASLDPQSDNYIAKVLNTDPMRFEQEEHVLYAHFPVENGIAAVSSDSGAVTVLSGSSTTNAFSGNTFNNLFGRFDARYSAPKTTSFISQPFGNIEYDLFSFETIADGANASSKFKVSISNIVKSEDTTNPYGSFTVLVREFNDSDTDMRILEQFGPCDLNPASSNYLGRVIGDLKTYFNFDAESLSDRKLLTSGRYANNSRYIRVVMNPLLERGQIPATSIPFGFRGLPVLKTNDTLSDGTTAISSIAGPAPLRLGVVATGDAANNVRSILPPVPFRFKVTKNAVATSGFKGQPGQYELTDSRLFWGVKFERLATTSSTTDSIYYSNLSTAKNEIVQNYSKFLGIQKMDSLVTGSATDLFNNNKFTLARVALPMNLLNNSVQGTINSYLTGTAEDVIRESAYIRNGNPDASYYTVRDGSLSRLTLASLAALTSSVYFNKFKNYAKFTNMFYGGFDGTNILDKDMALINDRATSSETGGKATSTLNIGLDSSFTPGVGNNNCYVKSYQVGSSMLLDPIRSINNIVTVPGIKDAFVTNYVADATSNYSRAIYLMDIPSYDDNGSRLFNYVSSRPDVDKTVAAFAGRAIDNSYAATYFPDVSVIDQKTGSPVQVAASVAALSALGFNDSVSFPWFAPAGFNRGALTNVSNVAVRLNSADRDSLYTNRINPIASFPNAGFVIFGQKTLQQAKSALDRVNVRRLLLEVKRIVSSAALNFVFEQNTAATRANFVASITPQLALIQTQQGVDQFKVVCDSTNNTQSDINQNRMNGRIIIAPTRAVEFIAVNFIVDSSGVSFT